MTFFDLIRKRRSTRAYLPQPLEKSQLDALVKAALMSPSSKSRNPWRFVVIEDREILQQLAACKEHGARMLAQSPAAIVVAADTSQCDVWIEDASIASIYIQLAAEALGLGSCWVQLRLRSTKGGQSSEEFARSLLGLPEQWAVLSVIALGHKAEENAPFDESRLQSNKVYYNSANQPYHIG